MLFARKYSGRSRLMILMLIALMLISASICACGGNDPGTNDPTGSAVPAADGTPDPATGLTPAQQADVKAIAEAFLESGKAMQKDSGLPVSVLESFIFYLYNGELTPQEDGYAVVSAAEADARIRRFFGVDVLIRTGKRSGAEQDYYFANDNYYVRTKEPAASGITILSCTENEDGMHIVKVRLDCEDGSMTELIFTINFKAERGIIRGCERLEGR